MKKVLLPVLLVLSCLMACSCGSGQETAVKDSGLEFVRIYPESPAAATDALAEGNLYKAGKINVLVLQGTYNQMGRQYGALLKEELNENYEGVVKGMKEIEGGDLASLQEYGDVTYDSYPHKYKEIINGLAETSGLGLEKAKLLNVQEMYVSAALVDWAKKNMNKQCSGMAVWGPYTSDGPLVFGRNYDLGFYNHQYAMMTVYNPIDGSIPTASFTFAGGIYVTSGMNKSGVFLELNNGSASDSNDFTGQRPFAPVDLFSFLEQSASLDELTCFFNTTNPDLAYIVQGADEKGAVSYEWSTSGVKVRQPDRDGILVATNQFFDPAWGVPTGETNEDFIVERRDNLLALGEENKGKFTPEVMMKVISTPLEEGGAFRAPNLTSYEIVAEPATLTMWVRVPEYQDWVKIELEPLFLK